MKAPIYCRTSGLRVGVCTCLRCSLPTQPDKEQPQ